MKFQSLEGFAVNCRGGRLKAWIYEVFKVQLRGTIE
jgi:hypothetical protein